jgi:hypothetical protein
MYPAEILNGILDTEHVFSWFFSACPIQRLDSIVTSNHSRLSQSHYLVSTFFAYHWHNVTPAKQRTTYRQQIKYSRFHPVNSDLVYQLLVTLAQMTLFIALFNEDFTSSDLYVTQQWMPERFKLFLL